jgi:RHS repeat-associated protein
MSLRRFRRSSAPLSLLTLVVFVSGLLPARVARADDPPASGPVGAGGSPSLATPPPQANSGAALATVDLSRGSAQSTIPFELPAARGQAQPSLALRYDSSAGVGFAGVGWTLDVPTIERRGASGLPRFLDGSYSDPLSDRFVFGGKPIVPICVVASGGGCKVDSFETIPSRFAGWTYFRAEVDDGVRLFMAPNGSSWVAQNKSGVEMQFGTPLDGLASTALDTGGATLRMPGWNDPVYRWNLVRQIDPSGNTIFYVWQNAQLSAMSYLTDIYDTPSKSAGFNAAAFAHHTHLSWSAADAAEAVTSQSPVWRMQPNQRLTGVDVTSATMNGSVREIVRRYHLGYTWNATGTQAFLHTVAMEGSCNQIAEGTNGLLPATNCPQLPPTTLGYTPANYTAPSGNQAVLPAPWANTSTSGVPFSLAVLDVNGDAVAEGILLSNSSDSDGALFNGGILRLENRPTTPPRSATIADLFPGTINTVLGDWIGDGQLNLLWMNFGANAGSPTSQASSYELYSLFTGWWEGVGPTTPPIPWTRELQGYDGQTTFQSGLSMDVDGDGLTDMAYVDGNAPAAGNSNTAQAYLSARDATGKVQPFRQLTTAACLVTNNFNNGSTVASVSGDMDGDGLPDLSYLTVNSQTSALSVNIYQNRGDGRFGSIPPGNSDACYLGASTAYSVDASVLSTAVVPDLASALGSRLVAVHDVDGDGFADLVVMSSDGIRVYLHGRYRAGVPGLQPPAGASEGQDTFNVHPVVYFPDAWGIKLSSDYGALQLFFGDIDGSGIDRPIPVSELPNGISGLDFTSFALMGLGDMRPGLLQTISNGLGATTTITYDTLNHAQSGRIPLPVQLVTSIVTTNGLSGIAAQSYEDDYVYASPVYDARDREFLGFKTVTDHRRGDASAPGTITTTTFVTETCPVSPGVGCVPSTDYWYHVARALPAVIQVGDESTPSNPLSTTVNQYQYLNLPYTQTLDGRVVRSIWIATTDLYLSDPSMPAGSQEAVHAIAPSVPDATAPHEDLSVTWPTASVDLRRTSTRDVLGNETVAIDWGKVATDQPIRSKRSWYLPPGDPTGWSYRLQQELVSYVDAATQQSVVGPVREMDYAYESRGLQTTVSSPLTGTLALQRSNPTGIYAPTPTGASAGVATAVPITLATMAYDSYGNLYQTQEPNNHCSSTGYDTLFNQLPVSSSVYRGGCNVSPLTSTRAFDRGLGRVTTLVTAADQMTTYQYDWFGRLHYVYQPSSINIGMSDTHPSLYVDYSVADASPSPIRKIHVQTVDGSEITGASYHDGWTYLDAFGAQLATLTPNDDASAWIVKGVNQRSANGHVVAAYDAFPYTNADGTSFDPTAVPSAPKETFMYDALGRATNITDFSGATISHLTYHPTSLSVDVQDGEQVLPSGSHPGAHTTVTSDGHGRSLSTTQHLPNDPGIDITTSTQYLATGEPTVITQSSGGSSTVRWMQYDTLGRMVLNAEPNTAQNMTAPGVVSSTLKAWRYAYNDNGELVGTSDARGCGENLFRDTVGRVVAEDYSPCQRGQFPYSPPAAGDAGVEVRYLYDAPNRPVPSPIIYAGSLIEILDRAQHMRVTLDPRGRVTQVQRQIARPFTDSIATANRYAPHWFTKNVLNYDEANRVTETDTGLDAADAPQLNTSRGSYVNTEYTARGTILNVTSPYGLLLASQIVAANGAVQQQVFGDVANTTANYGYYTNGRLKTYSLGRSAGPWLAAGGGYTPPAASERNNTLQGDLTDLTFTYDGAGNPTEIDDASAATSPCNAQPPAAMSIWPCGSQPMATKSMKYDDAYRLRRTTVGYAGGSDPFESPYSAEISHGSTKYPALNANCNGPNCNRLAWQTFSYDWQGNTLSSDDDQHVFPDRSLGTITNGSPTVAGPHQLATATGNGGSLSTIYDAAGNLAILTVTPSSSGSTGVQGVSYVYNWDELGHLSQAIRTDIANGAGHVAATMNFTYDSSNQRVLQSRVDATTGATSYDVDVFDSMHLTHAAYTSGDYERDATTESLYLRANGTTYAHVLYTQENEPAASAGALHTYMEFGDSLGSTTFVVDHDTGELVERPTFQSYGAVESDYRPDRWGDFRERYRYTGQDDDAEVGLVYFGQRYYAPTIGRWISPDPLTIHGLGSGFNPYQFVYGSPTALTDPDGLEPPNGIPDPITVALSTGVAVLSLFGSFGGGGGHGGVHGGKVPVAPIVPPPAPDVTAATTPAMSSVPGDNSGANDGASECQSHTCHTSYPFAGLTAEQLAGISAEHVAVFVLEGFVGLLGPESEANGAETRSGGTAAYTPGEAFLLIAAGMVVGKVGSVVMKPATKASSRALGRALNRAGFSKAAGESAHHIVAGDALAADPARTVLKNFGIGINDAANGVFLPQLKESAAASGSSAVIHQNLHTDYYYTVVNDTLSAATTREDALAALASVRDALLKGGP